MIDNNVYNNYDATLHKWINFSLITLTTVENNGTAFAPKQYLHQKLIVGVVNPKIQTPSRCNKRTGRDGPGNNPV